MKSDLEKFLDLLLQLGRGFGQQAGVVAWVALGLTMAIALATAILALRWIRGGGLGPGATHRLFAKGRIIKHWSKSINNPPET